MKKGDSTSTQEPMFLSLLSSHGGLHRRYALMPSWLAKGFQSRNLADNHIWDLWKGKHLNVMRDKLGAANRRLRVLTCTSKATSTPASLRLGENHLLRMNPNMKVALVTGANSGIGLATTKLLLENGFFVFGHYHSSSAALSKLTNTNLRAVQADFRSSQSIQTWLRPVSVKKERVDCLDK